MINATFVLAGRAVFTLEVPADFAAKYGTASHYTYRVNFVKGKNGYADAYFVSLLTGPDNTEDFTYLGMLNAATGAFRTTGKSKLPLDAMPVRLFARTVERLWRDQADVITANGFRLHHEGACGRCGRALTVPESIESGIGPECARRMGCGKPSRSLEMAV